VLFSLLSLLSSGVKCRNKAGLGIFQVQVFWVVMQRSVVAGKTTHYIGLTLHKTLYCARIPELSLQLLPTEVRYSDNQGIPPLLRNNKVYCRVHKSPPLYLILRQFSLVYMSHRNLFRINFNIILSLICGFCKWSLRFTFSY
jgi:hypothetical protein